MATTTSGARPRAKRAVKVEQQRPREFVPPRVGTQRNLSRETYGHEVGEVARRLRKPLMPWQQYAADVALEIDPETGELWYEEVVITVPRQSGKTTLILALLVWRCVVMARRLGRQTCTYLAQKGNAARKKLEREFVPMLRATHGLKEVPHSRARPRLRTEWKPSMNNGNEHILFGGDSYLQVAAPTETASHGEVLDMSVIDEAFAHSTDLVEQAVDAASITRRSPQTFIISTAGNRRSRFLWLKVLAGRQLIESGRTDSRRCYLEWSLPDHVAYDDTDAWWDYLPALGRTIPLVRLKAKLEKALANPDVKVDEEDEEPGLAGFRRGYLNQWVETPDLGVGEFEGEIPADEWTACGAEARGWPADSEIIGEVTIGVAVGMDGVSSSIAVAGRTPSGEIQVEIVESQTGTWWLEKRLMEACQDNGPRAVSWLNTGPTRAVSPEIQRAAQGFLTLPINGLDWRGACESWRARVKDRRVAHLDDALLDQSVLGAVRREVGTSWEFDMRAAVADQTPMFAAIAAMRAMELAPEAAADEELEVNLW